MYTRKIKEDLDCGIVIAMRVFGGKWKPCIIDGIHRGKLRPSELHKYIHEASPRVVDIQLSELLEIGVVEKVIRDGFPLYTEYHLTDMGKSILPIIKQLENWGTEHKHIVKERLHDVA